MLKHNGIEWDIPRSKEVYEEIAEEKANGFTDWLSSPELGKVKTASLRAFSVPNQDEMSVKEQSEWATRLSQRLRKPKQELTDADWGSSYKLPSLVYVTRDIGFRPTGVEKSNLSWIVIDDDKGSRFQIPKREDSKDGKNNWKCYLSGDTVRLLRMGLNEREDKDKYDGRNEIWLNREGNPYKADSLSRIMIELMREAGISTENRETGFYMFRQGVGTEIANSQGLSALMSQLRINDIETAKRYVQTDEESVREWIDTR